MKRLRVFLSVVAVALSGCSTGNGGSASPNPALSAGYAADYGQLNPPSGTAPAPWQRADVALLIFDDFGDGDLLSSAVRRELNGWGLHFSGPVGSGVQKADAEHGVMVLSCALQPLSGIGAEPYISIDMHNFLDGRGADVLPDLLERIDMACQLHSAVVVNCSWGMGRGVYSDSKSDAIWRDFVAGVNTLMARYPRLACVWAAGNERMVELGWPQTMFAGSDALVVGATQADGKTAPFTSYGAAVDLTAFGHQVWVLSPRGQWLQASGTSFSSPLVAGLLARWFHEDSRLTRGEALDRLRAGLEAGVQVPSPVIGWGDSSNMRQALVVSPLGPGWFSRNIMGILSTTRDVPLPSPMFLDGP